MARSLFGRLPQRVLYELFYQSARALGIRSYEVSGHAGNFFGPVYDQTVITAYRKNGRWSENIIELFRAYFVDGPGTFYDVGANVGLVSVPIARNPQLRVVAFEPDPHNCALLRANVAANAVPVEVINAAVADQPGTLRFARSEYNCGDHRLSADGSITVKTVTLDEYTPPPGRFAVKIDTQGAEPLIFKGGSSVLSQAGLVVAEFWPWGMKRMGCSPEPILDFLENNRASFTKGLLLRHDEPASEALAAGDILSKLKLLIEAGGEHDSADLVLMRCPG